MDVSGRSIQNVKVENNGLIEVDLSSLSSGVYSLLLKGNNSSYAKKSY